MKLSKPEMFDRLLRNGKFTRPKFASVDRIMKKIKAEAEKSPGKLTVHSVPKCPAEELEATVYQWIIQKREKKLAISTSDVIDKALSIDPEFKTRNQRTLLGWFYRFMMRHYLCTRIRARVS